MSYNSYERVRERLPYNLIGTFDDLNTWLYGGRYPKRSIRQDVVELAVQAFDWIVKKLAERGVCALDLLNKDRKALGQHSDCKRRNGCTRNCEVCIRVHVYRAIEAELKREYEEQQAAAGGEEQS